MRFRIEYLIDATDEKSVAHTYDVDVRDLDEALGAGWASALAARDCWKATGFLIRETDTGGHIVALEKLP